MRHRKFRQHPAEQWPERSGGNISLGGRIGNQCAALSRKRSPDAAPALQTAIGTGRQEKQIYPPQLS